MTFMDQGSHGHEHHGMQQGLTSLFLIAIMNTWPYAQLVVIKAYIFHHLANQGQTKGYMWAKATWQEWPRQLNDVFLWFCNIAYICLSIVQCIPVSDKCRSFGCKSAGLLVTISVTGSRYVAGCCHLLCSRPQIAKRGCQGNTRLSRSCCRSKERLPLTLVRDGGRGL